MNWKEKFDEKWSDYLPQGFMFQNGLYSDEAIKGFISQLLADTNKCWTCGTPLSRDCDQCKKDWES